MCQARAACRWPTRPARCPTGTRTSRQRVRSWRARRPTRDRRVDRCGSPLTPPSRRAGWLRGAVVAGRAGLSTRVGRHQRAVSSRPTVVTPADMSGLRMLIWFVLLWSIVRAPPGRVRSSRRPAPAAGRSLDSSAHFVYKSRPRTLAGCEACAHGHPGPHATPDSAASFAVRPLAGCRPATQPPAAPTSGSLRCPRASRRPSSTTASAGRGTWR